MPVHTSLEIRPLVLDMGCCGTSALRIAAPGYGLPGFDGPCYDLEPQWANVLIVAGRVSRPLAPLISTLFGRLARPRWVVAYGVCAVSGSVFDTLPLCEVCSVDVCVPGCPPTIEALCQALAHLPGRHVR
jgi:NADH-quinone oxidoreductase subunit B